MRKTFLSGLISLFLLAGCSSNTIISDLNDNTKTLYADSNSIEFNNTNVLIEDYYCSTFFSENYNLSVRIKIKNCSYETVEYNIKNAILIKEDTNAKYSISVSMESRFSLEAELERKVVFNSSIPTDVKNDKYKLMFELNNQKIDLYLYETPDELRDDKIVSYSISDTIVKTITVKENREIPSLYLYESADHLFYCDTWYTDLTQKNNSVFYRSTKITDDITLYGIKKDNLNFYCSASETYAHLDGINHIPSDGVIVIPKMYLNKEISIGNYAICDISAEKIYVPNTVRKIYFGNFKNLGKTKIYYEDTKEEWEALFSSKSEVVTYNIEYNVKSPY